MRVKQAEIPKKPQLKKKFPNSDRTQRPHKRRDFIPWLKKGSRKFITPMAWKRECVFASMIFEEISQRQNWVKIWGVHKAKVVCPEMYLKPQIVLYARL